MAVRDSLPEAYQCEPCLNHAIKIFLARTKAARLARSLSKLIFRLRLLFAFLALDVTGLRRTDNQD